MAVIARVTSAGPGAPPDNLLVAHLTVDDTTDRTCGGYDIPSLTIELRPATQADGGVIVPASRITPTFEENLPAALELAGQTLEAKA